MNEIKGQEISAVPGKISGCGISSPVRVTEVSGVKLSQAAVMDCTTAKALNSWVRNGVFPAVGRLGGGPSSLRVVAHYACRTRNNKRGAKISEHGKGRAVDIAGIRLKNGAELSVLRGWRDPVQGKVLKKMHKAACGPFGTVLGPNADKYHQDHFHFDTARYRSGAYCR
ncbi:extensin-like domain-containing protein [Aliiroseovarius pelagivivens]|uniref:extensin-like domain-containing protein n=1 Tax=Aliiroseovarius pelagivivens TaxID=1639690 RepID=UPI00279557C8|nr:extensin family protein [Aliiroseovarius pelagivivens]